MFYPTTVHLEAVNCESSNSSLWLLFVVEKLIQQWGMTEFGPMPSFNWSTIIDLIFGFHYSWYWALQPWTYLTTSHQSRLGSSVVCCPMRKEELGERGKGKWGVGGKQQRRGDNMHKGVIKL